MKPKQIKKIYFLKLSYSLITEQLTLRILSVISQEIASFHFLQLLKVLLEWKVEVLPMRLLILLIHQIYHLPLPSFNKKNQKLLTLFLMGSHFEFGKEKNEMAILAID